MKNSLPEKDMKEVFEKGQVFKNYYFKLLFLPAEEFKFALIVNNKVGTAVVRNKIKRLIREEARKYNQEKLHIVVVAYPQTGEIVKKDKRALREILSALLINIQL